MSERQDKTQLGIIGIRSYVGSEIKRIFEREDIIFVGFSSSELDITWEEQVDEKISNFDGETIVLVAGYTDVDGSETPYGSKMARDVNVHGVRNVACAAKKYGKHLILISSDFVFPGTATDPGPYPENHEKNRTDENVGKYGRSKSMGETVAQKSGCELTIIRIAFPFGNDDKPKNILNKLERASLKGYDLYTDQIITPTYIPELAEVIKQVAQDKIYGILHVACQPPVTPYEIGEQIANHRRLEKPKQGNVFDVKTSAQRPVVGGLSTESSNQILGKPSTNIYDAIKEVKGSKK